MARKILYSPGAGWTTLESDPDLKRLMLTYQPMIDALERGESLDVPWDIEERLHSDNEKKRASAEAELHPAIRQFVTDCRAIGKDVPYLGGLRDVKVATVSGRVRINECDGSESIEEEGEYSEWL